MVFSYISWRYNFIYLFLLSACSLLTLFIWWFFSTDRRSVFVNLRSHIPEMLLQLNGETRLVQATNSYDKLKVYLYFSKPVLNSSAEILNSLQTSQGMLLPVSGENIGDRRFGFLVSWFIQSFLFFYFYFFYFQLWEENLVHTFRVCLANEYLCNMPCTTLSSWMG